MPRPFLLPEFGVDSPATLLLVLIFLGRHLVLQMLQDGMAASDPVYAVS